MTWFDQMPPGSVTGLVLDTPDAHGAFEALSERGVEFTGEVREDPWGTSASFVDPDGNGWVLMQVPGRLGLGRGARRWADGGIAVCGASFSPSKRNSTRTFARSGSTACRPSANSR